MRQHFRTLLPKVRIGVNAPLAFAVIAKAPGFHNAGAAKHSETVFQRALVAQVDKIGNRQALFANEIFFREAVSRNAQSIDRWQNARGNRIQRIGGYVFKFVGDDIRGHLKRAQARNIIIGGANETIANLRGGGVFVRG